MNAAISMTTAGLAAALLACAVPPPAAAGQEGTVRVAIPMYQLESSAGSGDSAAPGTRVVGNCGIAFLYLSRVDNDETRAIYGFEQLEDRAVSYTAKAVFVNEDTDHIETDQASGPLRFRTSLQREVTRHTGSGIITVYAHLTAQTWKGDTCTSDKRLNEQIFVY